MNILVCIKEVPDDSVEISVKEGEDQADLSNIENVVNAFDTYSLEMAKRLQEEVGGQITVISIGPEGVKNSLKNCLSVGADEAYLIEYDDYKSLDARNIANLLKKAKDKLEEDGEKFDLICLGKETTDAVTSQVGVFLAEQLGLGVMTNVIGMKVNGDKLETKQETDSGSRTLESDLPCVVTINKPNYDPRYPTIKSKMAARRQEIPKIDLGKIEETPLVKITEENRPPQREKGIIIQEEEDEDSVKKAIDLLVEKKAL